MFRVIRPAVLGSTIAMLAVVLLTPSAVARLPAQAWGKPCSVVAKSDVEAITGATIARTKNNPGPVAACLYYEGSSPEAVVGVWLNAKPLTGTAPNQYAFDAKQAKNNSVNENFQNRVRRREEAFYFESDIFNRIEVLVDTRFFHVDGATLTLDQAESLARKVLAKS